MQTSGLVLDVYDDSRGDTIKSIYPTADDIPATVKEAHLLSASEHDALPDSAFALVLVNGDQKLRKFACVDAGNTTLSVEYFLKTAHKLPKEAQQEAATNLAAACGWFDVQPPEDLDKIAVGLGTLMAVPVAAGTLGESRRRLNAVKSLEGPGQIVTPHEISKVADVVGTDTMPVSVPAAKAPSKLPVLKTASAGRLVQGGHAKHPQSEQGVVLENNIAMGHKEQAPAKPQAHLPRAVDVTRLTAPTLAEEKKAQVYALGTKYPLDSYVQVKAASAYFDTYGKMFQPEERREFCLNMVKRADAMGIAVSDEARKYSSSGYAPEDEMKIAYETRRQFCIGDQTKEEILTNLFEKRAGVEPEVFCEALRLFDQDIGATFAYDTALPDPFWSTFGATKTASSFSETIGNDTITEQDLRRLAKIGMRAVKHTFSEEFYKEFRDDPVAIFSSLPLDQKKLLMRMAMDNSAPGIELTA